MIIYPAIDLSAGECVRLYQGDFASKTVYSRDPLERAREFQRAGAEWLHVVDLDGARDGAASQTETILRLARVTNLKLQVGGGIRQATQVETLLNAGVDRVVVGSRAVDAPSEVREWLSAFGPDALVLAFDVRMKRGVPFPATHGWQTESATSLWALLAEYESYQSYEGSGLRYVLCTDIERDGTLGGPNTRLYREIRQRFPGLDVLASGGVSALSDLRTLKLMGLAGTIVGKALYEKRIDLSEAIAC